MPKEQSYATHRRFLPLYHFFVQPLLVANVLIQAWRFTQAPSFDTGWVALASLAVLGLAFSSRLMALTVQNRLIRLEEKLRLSRLMPAEEHASIDKLSTRHLIGLRFADDSEVADLARRCFSGELKSAKDIKQNVKRWRPDFLRV